MRIFGRNLRLHENNKSVSLDFPSPRDTIIKTVLMNPFSCSLDSVSRRYMPNDGYEAVASSSYQSGAAI